IFDYNAEKFDTIFLLMNGIGMAGTLPELTKLLSHLKSLLNDGGQIIFDSSDLQYLYLEDDGSMNIPLGGKYYGELVYDISFHKQSSGKFNWFFADPYSVEDYAEQCGLKMEIIQFGEHYDYATRLTVNQ
ncbi:MAG: SAM-dependent methyltransferase, partial [Bacteroidales bacterium]|nr:SAM-dependent methyltransferase [Bacteroidales bacterium]